MGHQQIYKLLRKRSCEKIMFLHLSVSHSVHRGVSASVHAGITSPLTPPWAYTPLGRHTLPLGRAPPPADGHCSGRYASYWNAFLSFEFLHSNLVWSFFSNTFPVPHSRYVVPVILRKNASNWQIKRRNHCKTYNKLRFIVQLECKLSNYVCIGTAVFMLDFHKSVIGEWSSRTCNKISRVMIHAKFKANAHTTSILYDSRN